MKKILTIGIFILGACSANFTNAQEEAFHDHYQALYLLWQELTETDLVENRTTALANLQTFRSSVAAFIEEFDDLNSEITELWRLRSRVLINEWASYNQAYHQTMQVQEETTTIPEKDDVNVIESDEKTTAYMEMEADSSREINDPEHHIPEIIEATIELQEATVTRIIDGDTIEVMIDGILESVRLIQVDAPERGQPGFEETNDFLRQLLVPNTTVWLEAGPGNDRSHGRLRRYVWLSPDTSQIGENMLNALLLRFYYVNSWVVGERSHHTDILENLAQMIWNENDILV